MASYFEFEDLECKRFHKSLSEAELIFQLFWSRVAAKPVKTVTDDDDDEKKSIFQKFSKRRDTIICHWHKFSWGITEKHNCAKAVVAVAKNQLLNVVVVLLSLKTAIIGHLATSWGLGNIPKPEIEL